ncbi:MAG TPA: RDD family protein [Gammaproteobacteria bacterium]|nr:RDD family protein [Gammaproteobacteria bacterium]
MSTANPYAPPRGAVRDVRDPDDTGALAGRGARLGAAILDAIIGGCLIYGPLLIVLIIGAAMGSDWQNDQAAAATIFAAGGIGMLIGGIVWAVITWRLVSRNGQTIAKKMLNIKVVRRDGSPASLGRIFWLRNVVNGLLGIIPLYGLIDILFIFADDRQCLHDKLADTMVVEA